MKLRKKYRNILICIIIIFSIIASVTIVNASNFNTLRNRVEQVITKIEQEKSSNIINKILNEMSNEITEDESDPEGNGESEDKSGQTSGDVDEGQEENAETQNDNKYNVQMELNIITEEDEPVTEGNKLKITDITDTCKEDNSQDEATAEEDEENTQKSELKIKILNLISGEQIAEDEDGSFQMGGQGVIVDFSNMEKNKKYQVLIENLEVTEDYIKTIKNMTLELQVDDEENIVAQIINIVNSEEQDIGVEGQFWAKLHDTDGNEKVKIPQQSKDSNIQIQYKIDQTGVWQEYSEEATISHNGTIYAKASKNGKESSLTEQIVKNIDNEVPKLASYTPDNTEPQRKISVTLNMTDDESGIVKYGISRSDTEPPDTYIKADNNLTEEDIKAHKNANPQKNVQGTIDEIYENGKYYIWIWDTAGNCAKPEINIESVEEVYVAEIVSTTAEDDSMIGQYTSLYKALQASPENAETTIKIINEIFNENNVIENRDIILNLNGFKVNNSTASKPAITINGDASLKVLNTMDDGTIQSEGSLSSQNNSAILIKENGKLTLRRK